MRSATFCAHKLFVVAIVVMFGRVSIAEPVSFRGDLAPILMERCHACHSSKKAEGGYRVDSFERLAKAGDSELEPFTAKNLEESELFRRILSDDESERMPLETDPLTAEQIDLFKRWIDEGTKFDGDAKNASLISIIPPRVHPDPPEQYPATMPVTAVAFKPDGSELLAAGYHELTVWNPADGKLVRRIGNIAERTYGLDFSTDGKLLAVACGDPGRLGEVRLFDMDSGELKRVFAATSDVVLDVAFSPDGKRLAVAAADALVRIYDVETGEETLKISSHSDWVAALAWSDDGKRLATGSRDKTAKVFDTESGEIVVTYSGHSQPVNGVAFHPEGKEVFSSGADKKIHRWKIADGKKSADVGFGGEVHKLSRDGTFLFATSNDKTVRQFEAATHKQVRQYAGHTDWAIAATFHAGTKRIASGGINGEVHVWNADDGKLVTSFKAAPGYETEK